MTSELTSDLNPDADPFAGSTPGKASDARTEGTRREPGGGAELELVDRWWRAACNYLSVGQI